MAKYVAKFTKSEVVNGVAYYTATFTEYIGGKGYTIKSRYNDIKALWNEIEDAVSPTITKKTHIEFPPGKFFGNLKPEFIHRRMVELEKFFNALFIIRNPFEIARLDNFVSLHKIKDIPENETPTQMIKAFESTLITVIQNIDQHNHSPSGTMEAIAKANPQIISVSSNMPIGADANFSKIQNKKTIDKALLDTISQFSQIKYWLPMQLQCTNYI